MKTTGSFHSARGSSTRGTLPPAPRRRRSSRGPTWSPPWYLHAKAAPVARGRCAPTMPWPPRKFTLLVEEVHRAALALAEPIHAAEELAMPAWDRSPWPGNARARGTTTPRSRRGGGRGGPHRHRLLADVEVAGSRRSCPARTSRPPSPRTADERHLVSSRRAARCRAAGPASRSWLAPSEVPPGRIVPPWRTPLAAGRTSYPRITAELVHREAAAERKIDTMMAEAHRHLGGGHAITKNTRACPSCAAVRAARTPPEPGWPR
jgi:hypothetical protein